jgi:hypothetical protein
MENIIIRQRTSHLTRFGLLNILTDGLKVANNQDVMKKTAMFSLTQTSHEYSGLTPTS